MDFYEILQVDRRADAEVIQAAYRALARRHHPDVGGDSEKMVAINEAWAVLGDPRRRKGYDVALRRTTAAAVATRPAAGTGAVVEAERYRPQRARPPADGDAERVLDFGRYVGWSVNAISRQDPDYLLWLERTMVGRSLRSDIQRAMRGRPDAVAATAVSPAPNRRGRWFR